MKNTKKKFTSILAVILTTIMMLGTFVSEVGAVNINLFDDTPPASGSATGDATGDAEDPVDQELTINYADKIKVGKITTLEVSGNEGELSFESSNDTVATVSDEGVITGVNVGTATITVKAAATGAYKEATKSVQIIVIGTQPIKITTTSSKIVVGKKAKIAVADNKGAVTYKSSNTSIATVDALGNVTGVRRGTVKITVSAAATDKYEASTKEVILTIIPKAPTNLELINIASGIQLKWKPVTDATGYVVYKKNSKGTYIKYATVKTNSYIDKKIVKAYNTTNTYKVVAYSTVSGKNIYGELSGAKSIKRLDLATVKLSNATKGIYIKWTSVNKAKQYRVYRKDSNNSKYKLIKTTTSTNYIDTKVSNYKTYSYIVRAVVGGKLGGLSNVVSITKVPKLSKITLTKGTATATTSTVKISWKALTNSNKTAITYIIYKNTNGKGYKFLKTVKGNVSSYIDKSSTPNVPVSYKVYVNYKKCNSVPVLTSVINMTKPTIKHVVSNEKNNLTVRWNTIKGVTGYYVYDGSKKVATVKNSTAKTLKYTISGLKKGSSHTIYIQAYKTVGKKIYKSAKTSYKAAVKRMIPSNWKKIKTKEYCGYTFTAYTDGVWEFQYIDTYLTFDKENYEYLAFSFNDNRIPDACKTQLLITKYKGNAKKVIIPDAIDDVKVCFVIGACANNKTVEEIYISPGIMALMDVFDDADSLKKITIPANSAIHSNLETTRGDSFIGPDNGDKIIYTTEAIAKECKKWPNYGRYYNIKTGKFLFKV